MPRSVPISPTAVTVLAVAVVIRRSTNSDLNDGNEGYDSYGGMVLTKRTVCISILFHLLTSSVMGYNAAKVLHLVVKGGNGTHSTDFSLPAVLVLWSLQQDKI